MFGSADKPDCDHALNEKILVSPNADGSIDVSLHLYFTNGHSCDFEGVGHWRAGRITAKSASNGKKEEKCALLLYSNGKRIVSLVEKEHQTVCQSFCGMRGTLDGAEAEKEK